MEQLFLYFIKTSGLMIAFFLVYHFLLHKETFFNSNRWFLLSGLVISALLPLFFVKKIVFVSSQKLVINSIAKLHSSSMPRTEIIEKTVEIDWLQIVAYSYAVITILLLLRVVFNLISLFKILKNRNVIREEKFQFIDVNENLSPFSFFNYIVFNSSLYSQLELQSILLHEKTHSTQRHSLDVLITNLFTVIFWFNPFIYLYKKAIIQNLEYIADSNAVAQIEDKKAYQMALLKVVSYQNCLPITNHFYQSLIKKRIVMLNKNQSKKKNLLKYAVIIPALFVFVMLFQVKVIAQEVKTIKSNLKQPNSELLSVIIYKNSSNDDLKKNTEMLSETKKVTLKFSKIKRNSIGEIIAIKIDYKDNQTGKSGSNYINSSDPIQPIYFYKTDTLIGISNIDKLKPDNDLIELEELKKLNSTTKIIENRIAENNEIKPNETNIDQPIAPEAPTPPIAPVINFNSATFPNLPKAPTAPNGTPLNNKKEWDKFEKKMEEFEKKMKTIEPEIEAYAEKMSNLDEQMKPYEKQMEAFEKQMEVFEKQMDEYQDKMEAYQKKMHLQK